MCGICGILFFDQNRCVDPHELLKMTEIMRHRGPDGHGIYINNPCGLGHRRLSIIDIASGQQPMSNAVGNCKQTVVFNGEIYNYLQVKSELQEHGYSFRTNSDTEVILLAYQEWGTDCVQHLQGMFAFAIWDEINEFLFLARDRIGEKPLYYFQGQNCFIFASEVKSLLASDKVTATIEPAALDSFMTLGYVPGSLTMFKNIFKLLPGHLMVISTKVAAKPQSYWSIDYRQSSRRTFVDAIDELDHLLKESVKMRLMSEVPLGVFLSGGLDSSAITALMHQLTSRKIKTFSVGYKDAADASELNYATIVAKKFNTEHHEFILEPDDFFDSIPTLVNYTEEPLVETAAIPLYRLAQEAKNHATVLLSGEGSDELFAGYGLYHKMLNIQKWQHLGRILKAIPDLQIFTEKYCKYFDWILEGIPVAYRGISCDLTQRVRKRLFTEDFQKITREHNYTTNTFAHFRNLASDGDSLSQLLAMDLKTWLVDDLLLKADKMTMAASVELRVPFLDHKLVEYVAALPSSFKLQGHEGKYILKKMMERYLPKEIIYRKKMGFAVPTKRWFGADLLQKTRNILLDPSFKGNHYFNTRYIENILISHASGREDHSRRIFSLLVFAQWLNIFKI
ncbi:asparagine synthase (glutamine-hydrolyzing) [Candidatus Parcubacteria bacterium]|nr:MAG: asparagine synthase (glutamine-hydrolyzing) [Candidatus Parcubacteria bacterium]